MDVSRIRNPQEALEVCNAETKNARKGFFRASVYGMLGFQIANRPDEPALHVPLVHDKYVIAGIAGSLALSYLNDMRLISRVRGDIEASLAERNTSPEQPNIES